MAKKKITDSMSDLQLDSINELNNISDSHDDIAKIQKILISNLVTKDQDRTNLDMISIERLSRSILAVDEVLNPLVVEQVDGGKYLVICGHRRLEACKILVREGHDKFASVLCKIKVDNLSLTMLVDNLARKDLNAVETAIALRKRLDDNDLDFDTQKDLAYAIGKHESFVSRHLKLLDLPKEVLNVGVLGLVLDPARLFKLAKLDRYVDACEALVRGVSFKDVLVDFANGSSDKVPEPVFKLKGNNLHFLCHALSQIKGLDFSYIKDEPIRSLNDFLVHLSKEFEESDGKK